MYRQWQRALSASELNKRFYRELANWYFWATHSVNFPIGAGADPQARNAMSVIRLITRLVFVWFIKEKGLVREELFDETWLNQQFVHPPTNCPDESSYYRGILQNLFFATLNTHQPDRAWASHTPRNYSAQYLDQHAYRFPELSALALALYFAALLITPRSQVPLLVLDDVLIGLDLSNRLPLFHMLKTEFPDWQIILLTHDKVWFDMVKEHTAAHGVSGLWRFESLFSEINHNGLPQPLHRTHKNEPGSLLERAQQHLNVLHDDRAAAVYGRAAFEVMLKNFCDARSIPVRYRLQPRFATTEDFWVPLEKWLTDKGHIQNLRSEWAEGLAKGWLLHCGFRSRINRPRTFGWILGPRGHEAPLGSIGDAPVCLRTDDDHVLSRSYVPMPLDPESDRRKVEGLR